MRHSTTPPTTPPDFEQIPAELKALPQWVCWKLEDREGKSTKVPYDAQSGRRARSNDPTTWTTFDTAVDAYLRGGYAGVGFMFWEGDELTGLDLDHVIDLETGEIDPRALEILERFKGTYCEISPSGTGFRIFTRGSPGRSGKNEGRGKWLEVYTHPSHRYLTVTGHHWPQSADEVTAQQNALDWLHEKYLTKPAKPKPATNPVQPSRISMDDAALLDKARAAANGYQFGQLWNGDTTAHRGDHSSADLALCSMLAFWTGKDVGRMDRLFRQSGLMRSKWERADYRQRTLNKAIIECQEVYSERKGGNGHDHAPPADYSDYPEAHSPEHAGPDSDTDNAPADSGLPEISFTAEDFLVEPPPAPFLITGFFPVDVCFTNATGGTGKSTFELFKCIHVILGMEFLGMPIERPGPIVYVTAEDDGDRIKRRLYWIMEAMDLTPTQRRQVAENFKVVNLCGLGYRLAALDRYGNITRTSLADRIVKQYRAITPVLIEFDPVIKFGAGERHVNDSEDALINAMMFIGRELSCAIHGIHHVSKFVFRDGIIDHLAGRGGSAMGDGARGVYSLVQVDKETAKLPSVSSVYQHYLDAGELMALFVTKLTDCKRPRDPFILRRNGWNFELLAKPTPEGVEQARRQQQQEKIRLALGKLMAYLKEWSFRPHTQRDLESARGEIGLSRDEIRDAVSLGIRELRLVERDLPENERRGARKTGIYLAEGGA